MYDRSSDIGVGLTRSWGVGFAESGHHGGGWGFRFGVVMITGAAGGTRYVALPPADGGNGGGGNGGGGSGGRVVLVWHLIGRPGTPEDMAAALPLRGLDAWRVYPALPPLPLPGAPGAGPDVVLDWYAPLVERAVAGVPALLEGVRRECGVPAGPVDVAGGSAGGHAALLTAVRGVVPVRRVAVVNPAVTVESVLAASAGVSEAAANHVWSEASRAAAARLDVAARADRLGAPPLVVRGEAEYPEFRPVQDALCAAVPGARLVEVPGLAHMLVSRLDVVEAEVTAWLA